MKEEDKFEKELINKVIQDFNNEPKEFNNIIEIAYYLFLKTGKEYKYRVDFKYRNHNTKEELDKKTAIYNEETSEKGEATCNRINPTYCKILNKLGINAKCNSIEITGEIKHVDVQFQNEDDGAWYYADLTDDLMHIKTGMKTRSFGISLQQLKDKGERVGLISKYYSEKMKNEKWASISEETLMQLDEKFGHSYHGIYTNDIIKMLRDEFSDEESDEESNEKSNKKLLQDYFQTTDEDLLLQRKLEFILKNIGIINRHSGNVGDVEATMYYEKLVEKILEDDFKNKRIKFYKCFKEINGKRQICDILTINNNGKQVYYMFNNENQEYQKIKIEELLNMPVYFHDKKNDKLSIQKLIEGENNSTEMEQS